MNDDRLYPTLIKCCPCCKASISAVTEEEKAYQNRYCHKCGQAIDWSDVE